MAKPPTSWARHRCLVVLTWLLCACSPARADQYQDAIAKAFQGFHILSRSEFDPEIQKEVKGNPALITGRFNDDDLEDFAAIIRSDVKKLSSGKTYYDGKFVVCHAGNNGYKCQSLGTRAVYQGLELYLHRVGPGVSCLLPNGKRIKTRRDAIGTTMVPSLAGSVQMYMPDGTYYECAEH